jgi:hypothetical protein
MVANFEIVQIALSEPPEVIKNVLRDNRRRFEDYNFRLIGNQKIIHKEFYDKIPSGSQWLWLKSDITRFEYLYNFDDVLYLDWEVKINKIPTLKELTWVDGYDYWAIYNHTEHEAFKYILEEGIRKVANYPSWKKIKRNWLLSFIQEVGGATFPKDCFTHKGCYV